MIHISVTIPTRNRSTDLKIALEALRHQTYSKENFEVIVVDNGSTDDTKAVALQYETIFQNFQYVYDKRPGLHIGRHCGYKISQGDILAYLDDDSEPMSTWLDGINESFQDEAVVLVGGKDLPKYEVAPPFWIVEKWHEISSNGRCMAELSLIDLGDEIKEIEPWFVYGCNYAVRKSLLDETKGFHPDGMPFERIEYRGDGETYVSKYIAEHGYKTMYNPKATVFHLVPKSRMTIDYFKKRAFCEGVEMSYMDLRYHTTSQKPMSKYGAFKHKLYNRLHNKLGHDVLRQVLLTDFEREINKSRHIGYDYHQQMYNRNEELRAWVHKDNYLD